MTPKESAGVVCRGKPRLYLWVVFLVGRRVCRGKPRLYLLVPDYQLINYCCPAKKAPHAPMQLAAGRRWGSLAACCGVCGSRAWLFGEGGEAGGGGGGERLLGFDAELLELFELADDAAGAGVELADGGFVGVVGLVDGFAHVI